MHVKPGVPLQPSPDLWVLMGGVIVGDDVDVEVGWGFPIDGFEEGEPLLMAMTRRQPRNQLASR